MPSRLEVLQGKQTQTPNESVPYRLNASEWASTISSASVTVLDVTDSSAPLDVTATVAPGEAAGDGGHINLPNISGLTDGHEYLVKVLFSGDGGTYEAAFRITCVDFIPNY